MPRVRRTKEQLEELSKKPPPKNAWGIEYRWERLKEDAECFFCAKRLETEAGVKYNVGRKDRNAPGNERLTFEESRKIVHVICDFKCLRDLEDYLVPPKDPELRAQVPKPLGEAAKMTPLK